MIGRSVLAKVVAFAVITVLGVGYVLVRYVHVARGVFGHEFTAYVDLADSGGIYSSASVTYRGVEIGRVGDIALRPDGIRVALDLDTSLPIPADTRAVVRNGSAIGEQYLDLQPADDRGPYLHGGSVIAQDRTDLPLSSETLLVDLDKLVNSVPKDDLRTLIGELGTAFSQTGPDLQRLLDSSHALLTTASQHLPQTIGLLDAGATVLDTQQSQSSAITDFAHHLASLSDQLRTSDPDLRAVLSNGVTASGQLQDLVATLQPNLAVLLGNLVSLGQMTAVRLPNLQQVLIGYPYIIATAMKTFPGDGTVHFTVPFPPASEPQACTQGYDLSLRRDPSKTSTPPFSYSSYCKAPTTASVGARGAREGLTPDGKRIGDEPWYDDGSAASPTGEPGGASTQPSAASGSAAAGSTTSGATAAPAGSWAVGPDGTEYEIASTGGQQRVLGDGSWTWLLLGPLGQ